MYWSRIHSEFEINQTQINSRSAKTLKGFVSRNRTCFVWGGVEANNMRKRSDDDMQVVKMNSPWQKN